MVQELAVVAAVFGFAYQNHINIFAVHAMWLVATLIDVTLGFKFGGWIKKKYGTSSLARHAGELVSAIERRIGTNGRRLTLVVSGFLNFPYVNGFLGPWLRLSFADTLVFILIGDALWYFSIWGALGGISILAPDSRWIVVLAMGVIVALIIVVRVLYHKKKHT